MSVQKLDKNSKVLRQNAPYAQICNKIIDRIKNNDAFRAFAYLYSKSANWVVIKEDVKRVVGCGDGKIKKIFSYLNRSNLIQYVDKKDELGRFLGTDIMVLNGAEFDPETPYETAKKKAAKKVTKTVRKHRVNTAGSKTERAEKRTSGAGGLLKKDITKERKALKKESTLSAEKKSYCPGTHDLIVSEEAIEIAKSKELDVVKTANSFMAYAKSSGWLRVDWKAAFVKWLIDEKSINTPKHQPKNLGYVNRCTVSEEFKNARKGDESIAREHIMKSRKALGARV